MSQLPPTYGSGLKAGGLLEFTERAPKRSSTSRAEVDGQCQASDVRLTVEAITALFVDLR